MSNYEEIAINALYRQYLYTNIAKLCVGKGTIYNKYFKNLTKQFSKDILNFETCSSSALDYFWGRIFKITRTFYNEETSQKFTLTDDDFREIIKLRAFATNWDSSLGSLNSFLNNLFKSRGNATVIDNLNMTTLIFSFTFKLNDWEIYLFKNTNILPRPAGVGAEVSIIDDNKNYFGMTKYKTIIVSPITIGFGTYKIEPMGNGVTATYNSYL